MDPDHKQQTAVVANSVAESSPPSGLLTQATIVGVLLGLALAVVMATGMLWLGDYYLGKSVETPDVEKPTLREMRAADQRELTSYGWINRQQGHVRIPIERAMELLVQDTLNSAGSPTPPVD